MLLWRLDPHALGVATGTVLGGILLLATAILLIRDGAPVGPHLGLLGQFLPGYDITWGGAIVGSIYGFGIGYIAAGAFALSRNVVVAAYMRFVWTRLQHHAASDLLDRLS